MAQVQVNIDGKLYRMACDDGQEDHLRALAQTLNSKVSDMKVAFGEIGDMRLTVMAAITIADDLSDATRRLEAMETEIAGLKAAGQDSASDRSSLEAQAASSLQALAERIERIAKAL